MAPLCYWVIRGQYRVSSQGRVHNGALVACLWYQCWETFEPEQEISRKVSLLIHLISLLEWAKGVTFIFVYIFFFNYRYNPAKSSILQWIILILAVGNSLNLHIFEFSQFPPDLIAPINFGSRRTSPWSPQVSAAVALACSPMQVKIWPAGKQAWASGILYRLYKRLPSSGECQKI